MHKQLAADHVCAVVMLLFYLDPNRLSVNEVKWITSHRIEQEATSAEEAQGTGRNDEADARATRCPQCQEDRQQKSRMIRSGTSIRVCIVTLTWLLSGILRWLRLGHHAESEFWFGGR